MKKLIVLLALLSTTYCYASPLPQKTYGAIKKILIACAEYPNRSYDVCISKQDFVRTEMLRHGATTQMARDFSDTCYMLCDNPSLLPSAIDFMDKYQRGGK